MKAIAYTWCAVREVPEPSQSILHQEMAIQDHCQTNHIELLHIFHDIGVSGLTFERPGWNEMETYLTEHPNEVEALIVADYARIGRNAEASLEKIDFLKKEYGVKILPLKENKFVSLDDYLAEIK